MSARKTQPTVKAAHFCESERDLPIAGTPAPKSCPFCGVVDCSIVFKQHENGTCSAHVQCDHCGIEGPFTGDEQTSYDMALRAAELWNTRKGVAAKALKDD